MAYEADEVAHHGWEVIQTILGASVGYLEAKGKGNKEIAARMGVSLSMVNQYISRGKLACAACREALDHDD